MFVLNKKRSKPFSKYLWLCYYAVLLFWECVKANIDLASRILGPKIRINPGIVKVKTALRSDTGLTFLANAITLSAGTFCVDIDAQNGILYIHWIDVSSQDIDRATQLICGRFEMVLKNIFE
jgi:multicomponent Na+:H+ antiporter subunit E